MKIRKKLLFANTIVLILVVILVIAAITSMQQIYGELEKQRSAGELIRHLVNFNVVTEDVIIYGYERSWQQWTSEYDKIFDIISKRDMFSESVSEQFEHLLSDFNKLRSINVEAEDFVHNEFEERLSSHIRLIIRGIINNAFRIYDNSTLKVGKLLIARMFLLIGYSILLAVILALISIIVLRRLTSTFGVLIEGAERIIAGDLTVSFDLSTGKSGKVVNDEISELTIAFNTMTSKLTRTLEELEVEVEERRTAEVNLENALEEKIVLIQELYHRTKNNMQLIQSMMNLRVMQSDNIELKKIVDDIQAKIYSMSLVHEKLYQSKNLNSIDLGSYFTDLTSYLHQSFSVPGSNIEFQLKMTRVEVPMEIAVPCGIAISELITNSFKHALIDGRKTIVVIELTKLANEMIQITISDNGPGLPEGYDLSKIESLGLKTVQSLVESQMGGEFSENSTEDGVCWLITINKNGRYLKIKNSFDS